MRIKSKFFKQELVIKIKTTKQVIYPVGSQHWFGSGERAAAIGGSGVEHEGVDWRQSKRETEQKGPQKQPSLLVLAAAAAPMAHGGYGAEWLHSACSPRQNAAQEDRKEAAVFFTGALSV